MFTEAILGFLDLFPMNKLTATIITTIEAMMAAIGTIKAGAKVILWDGVEVGVGVEIGFKTWLVM